MGSYFGKAEANINLIPIFKENEIKKNPESFLRCSPLIVKKIAIAAPSATKLIINGAEFLMPGSAFELAYGLIDIEELYFCEDTNVTIAYVY